MSEQRDNGVPGAAEIERAGQRLDRLPQKLLLRWASTLRATGDATSAAQVLGVARQRYGEGSTYLEAAARVAWTAGDRDEAERLLRERLERFPSATCESALGRFLMETGRLDEAGVVTKKLLGERPDLATVTALAADLARAEGRLEIARAHYLGVIDAQGEQVAALTTLAEMALDEGDTAAALAFLRRARTAAEDPERPAGAATLERLAELGARAGDPTGEAGYRERAATMRAAVLETLRSELEAAFEEHHVFDGAPATPSARARAMATPSAASQPVDRGTKTVAAPATPVPAPAAASTPAAVVPQRVAAPATPVAAAVRPEVPSAARASAGMPAGMEARARRALREWYGHTEFRPSQWDVISRVLAGEDTLAIIPTGGGKSLTYQLPAMLLEGVTLVVSPLIALMKDQVDSAPAPVRDRVALVNSDLSASERQQVLDDVARGRIKLLYAAPERLLEPSLQQALLQAGLALLVVDEAHCVSMWGHDFRPDYLTIPLAIRQLGQPPLLAVTATATPQMGGEIRAALGRPGMGEVRASVYRPNLYYEVIQVQNRDAKIAQLVEICRREKGAGIVYVSSRKDAEMFAESLGRRGVQAVAYHAGMDRSARATNQERFMNGQARVVVATVAFGMGIDKADVRFIVHTMPPSTVEAYAQETGRAGRDGKPSRCVLLTAPADRTTLRTRLRRDQMAIEDLRTVYREASLYKRGEWAAVDLQAMRGVVNPGDDADGIEPKVALGYLGQAGLVTRAADAPTDYRLARRAGMAVAADGVIAERWGRVEPLLGEGWATGGRGNLETATACTTLGMEPVELEALLAEAPGVAVERGRRAAWFRMPPAPADAGARLEQLLAQARAIADARIETMMDYIEGNDCRHVALADALGEALTACGTRCDICSPTTSLPKPARAGSGAPQRRQATAAEAAVALAAVRDLPFPMGRAGMVRLLSGAEDSRVREDRSEHFGALSQLSTRGLEHLFDALIEAGMLEPYMEGEYRLLRLTQEGSAARAVDLEQWFATTTPTRDRNVDRSARSGGKKASGEVALAAENVRLYEQLVAWRLEEARAQMMPPYVIANNATLRAVADRRPMTLEALAKVPGMGEMRAEKYGSVILALVAADA
jgi:ATP-dependent DNA helicase RecQ